MDKIISTFSEYNLEIHKRILGVHTDKYGKEFTYQPERSKREDSLIRDKIIEEMRCSEHLGN